MNEREELDRLRKLKRLKELEEKASSSTTQSAATAQEPGFIESRINAIKSIADPETWKSIAHDLGPEGWEETRKKQIAFQALPKEERERRNEASIKKMEDIALSFMPITRLTPSGLKAMGATPDVIDATLKSGLQPVIDAGKAVGRTGGKIVSDVANLFLPKGAERIVDQYQRRIVGDVAQQKLADALKSAKEIIPGSKPTAAEAVAHIPEGSPIIAHQKIVAATPGGISGKFGQRFIDQETARTAAEAARKAATDPLREAALKSANQHGGVNAGMIVENIEKMASVPGQRASDVVNKTLTSVKEKLSSLTDDAGKINAEDLYTVRKEIGNVIRTHSKETANFDKRLASKLQGDIQKNIDDAIESSGGKGWKDYLEEYSKRTKDIEADIARSNLVKKPLQKTMLQGGVNVAEETRTHIPQLLSRPAMLANALMRSLGKGIEPRVDAITAERYLNPQLLAEVFSKSSSPQSSAIMRMLLEQEARNQTIPRAFFANQSGE